MFLPTPSCMRADARFELQAEVKVQVNMFESVTASDVRVKINASKCTFSNLA